MRAKIIKVVALLQKSLKKAQIFFETSILIFHGKQQLIIHFLN